MWVHFVPLLFVSAQEAIINDDSLEYPFRGIITYTSTHKTKLEPVETTFLPDSMELAVDYPLMSVSWFGGLSDSLFNRMIWNAETGAYALVLPGRKLVLSPPVEDTLMGEVLNSTGRSMKILDFNCEQFILDYAGSSWKDEIWITYDMWIPVDTAKNWKYKPPFIIPGKTGMPLKMVRSGLTGSTTTTAIEVQRKEIPSSYFRIPDDYQRETFELKGKGRFPMVPD